jgi:transposase, IS5 family
MELMNLLRGAGYLKITTVQEKAIPFRPTRGRCIARERLVRLAEKHGITLRRSYARVGKLALLKQQRYAHARQFKRAKRSLKTLKTFLGRVIRDILRRIKGNEALEKLFIGSHGAAILPMR